MHTSPAVIVFGASGTIGSAIATAFGQRGWTVGVHFHTHSTAAQDTVAKINTVGGRGILCQGDVTSASCVSGILQDFTHARHSLDVAVWAVGVSRSALTIKTSLEDWTHTLQTNLTGAYHVLKAVAPIYERQKNGSVVLLGSLSAEQGKEGQIAYAASKSALIGLMRSAAQEWGRHNIRINVVFPGWHGSSLSSAGWPSALEGRSHTLQRTPTLESVAATVYHLSVSPDVSGQIWNLDSRIW